MKITGVGKVMEVGHFDMFKFPDGWEGVRLEWNNRIIDLPLNRRDTKRFAAHLFGEVAITIEFAEPAPATKP